MNESTALLPCHGWKPVAEADRDTVYTSLTAYLETIEHRLLRCFPKFVVRDAIEAAQGAVWRGVCSGALLGMETSAQRRWAWVAARNAAVTILRRPRLRALPPAESLSAPLIDFADMCELAQVPHAVAQLPPDSKQLIDLVYFEGLNMRAAARRMGIAESTFRRRHEDALSSLRFVMERLARESEK